MDSKTTELTVTYFPYTFVYENDLKSLILYFDIIRLLQVIPGSDPGLPEMFHSSQRVQCFYPISDSMRLENVKKAYRTYHQLRNVHQNGGLLQLLHASALHENFEDSRPGMVAQIRRAHPRLAPEDVKLINDAVFILLAHQFDHDNLELDRQLEQIRGLEVRFHEEAGIGTEEEGDAVTSSSTAAKGSYPPRTQHSFQRLRAWTRLYCLQEETALFLPVTTSAEVTGEIVERLASTVSAEEKRSPATGVKQYCLSVLPDPQLLSLAEVIELRQSLQEKSYIDTWRKSVLTTVHQLQETIVEENQWRELENNLQEAAEGFQRHWPVAEKPQRYLQLKCFCYPNIESKAALSKATALEPPGAKRSLMSVNGITLLLSPAGG